MSRHRHTPASQLQSCSFPHWHYRPGPPHQESPATLSPPPLGSSQSWPGSVQPADCAQPGVPFLYMDLHAMALSCHSGVGSSVTSSEKPSLSTSLKIAFQSLVASPVYLLPSSYYSLVISYLVPTVSLNACVTRAISYRPGTSHGPADFLRFRPR